MKKIITLSLTLILIFSIMTNVYAASSFKVSMEASKSELEKNEEFTVEVRISDIQDEKGIITIGGEIEYDEDSLTLVKVENGDDTWSKPSYSKNTKKFVLDRDDRGKEDETLFKIVFKVNENSVQKPNIALKNVVGSNGSDDINCSDVNIDVTVKEGTSNPSTSPSTSPSASQNPSNDSNKKPTVSTSPSASQSSTEGSNKKITSSQVPKSETGEKTTIPYTGLNNNIVLLLIILIPAVALAVFSCVKIRQINKSAKEIKIK